MSPGPDAYVDVWDALRLPNQAVICFPRTPTTPGDRFYLGFERSLAGNAIRMTIAANVEGIGVIPTKPPLRWEVWQGAGWIPRHRVPRHDRRPQPRRADHAARPAGPRAADARRPAGVLAAGPRARAGARPADVPHLAADPPDPRRLDRRLGDRRAQRARAPREVLGTSTGKPDQRFHDPQHARAAAHARRDGHTSSTATSTTEWTEVPDFVDSGPDDRHFVWNSTTGEVRFGPLIRYPDGTTPPARRGPPRGRADRRHRLPLRRRRGRQRRPGDARPTCARRCRTSTGSRTSPPAIGGVDAETVDNAKRRGPHSLRAGGRAVTVEDFERLASEADPAIARVRCLPPEPTGKPIRLLSCPTSSGPASCCELDDFALTDDMVDRVSDHLDERRILGTAIEIGTPFYQGVTIAALLTARPGRPVTLVRERALSTLYRYLNPLDRRAARHRLAVRRRPQRGQRVPAARGRRGRRAGRGGAVLRARPAQPRARRLRQGARQARAATRCSSPPTTRWSCDERGATTGCSTSCRWGWSRTSSSSASCRSSRTSPTPSSTRSTTCRTCSTRPSPRRRWSARSAAGSASTGSTRRCPTRCSGGSCASTSRCCAGAAPGAGMQQLLELISEAPADRRGDRRDLRRGRGAGRHRPRRAARRVVRLGDRRRPAAHRARRAAGVGDVRAVRRRPPHLAAERPSEHRRRSPSCEEVALMADIVCPECGQVTSLTAIRRAADEFCAALRLPAVLGADGRCRSSPARRPATPRCGGCRAPAGG